MNRNTIISGFILSAVLMVNTGCIEVPFVSTAGASTEVRNSYVVSEKGYKEYKNPDVECNDDLTIEEPDCDVGTISEDDVKRKPRNGEEHVFKSIRGKVIHIIERSNGFLFPEYQGKVILLEIFGKNCPHCLRQIPVIEKIRSKYRGKLEVIAIQAQDRMDRDTAIAYINGHRIRYPIIEGDDATTLQYFIQKTYGWRGILPYTLVVKDGVTEFAYSGEINYADIEKDMISLFGY